MEKMEIMNSILLNKFVLMVLVMMILMALTIIPGAPTVAPFPDPL